MVLLSDKVHCEELAAPVRLDQQCWPEDVAPVVSIICITYNHERFIAEAIESFLMQETTFPVEILIHDDASTDKTSDIVRDYHQRFPHLIRPVIQEVNQYSMGVRVLPILMEASRGRYLAVCEGDDYWTCRQKLQIQKQYLDGNPTVSLVCTNRLTISEEEVRHPSRHASSAGESKILRFSQCDVLGGVVPPTQTMMLRSDGAVISLFKYYTDVPSGDRLLAYACSLVGELHQLPEVTAVYRDWGGGVWNRYSVVDRWKISIDRLVGFHYKVGLGKNAILDERLILRCRHALVAGRFFNVAHLCFLFEVAGHYRKGRFAFFVDLVAAVMKYSVAWPFRKCFRVVAGIGR